MVGRAPVSALAAVLVVRLADEAAVFLPFGALESFRADLGLTYAQAGVVLAAIGPGAVVGGIFAAAADRWSRRVIAAGGAFGFAVSLAMFAVAASFPALVVAASVMGMASTAMVDAAEVAMVDIAGTDLRRYLARSNLLATAGDLLGPALIAGAAALGLSWRVPFAAGAGLMGLYGLALTGAPLPGPAPAPAAPPDDTDDGEARERPCRLRSVLRDPAVWVLGVLGFLLLPFDEPLIGFTIALLEHDRGASPAAATAVVFVAVAGGVLAFTSLARRLGGVADERLLLWAVAAMTVGTVSIALAPALAVAAAGGLLASVGLNLSWLAIQHRSLTLRPGQVGTTKAVLGTIESTGFWIPVAIGAVADRAGLTTAVGSFGLVGAVMFALAWWSARRAPAGAGTRPDG